MPLQEELESMTNARPNIDFWYTVDLPSRKWKFILNFDVGDMIRQYMLGPDHEFYTVICGRPPTTKFACIQNVNKFGFSSDCYVELFVQLRARSLNFELV